MLHHHRHAPRPAPTRPAGPAAGGGGASAAPAALQRDATLQREITTEPECLAAIRSGRYAEAVHFLIGRSQDDVTRLLSTPPISTGEADGLLGATPGNQHTTRGLTLEAGFRAARGAGDWSKAARYVSVLDDPGIDRMLGAGLSVDDLKRLFKGSREGAGGGDERLLSRIRSRVGRAEGQVFGTLTATPGPAVQLGANGRYGFQYRMEIRFVPDPIMCDASSIAFVQTLQAVETNGTDSVDNRDDIKKRMTGDKTGVDRGDKQKYGFYGQRNDGQFKLGDNSGSQDGSTTPAPRDAVMIDRPEGKAPNSTWRYEASVVGRDGKDTGLVYAVVKWGFSLDANHVATALPTTFHQRPTASFGAAVAAWNTQAGKNPSPSDQQKLPAQRMLDPGAPAVPAAPVQRSVHPASDPAAFARFALGLQRAAGNAAVGALLAPVQRCGGKVHEGCSCAEGAAVQRDKGPFGQAREEFTIAEHRAVIDPLRGLSMEGLLPAMAALPQEIRTDEKAADQSGGARLVLAMRAVAAKGTPWERFVDAQSGILGGLPGDQVGAVVQFLGGPKDYGYYPSDKIVDKHGGAFDGSLDPVGGVVTLYFRVRFDTDAVRWGASLPGTPGAEQEAAAGLAKFEADFKRVIESSWSFKGKVQAGAPVGAVKQFKTRVVVAVVRSGEHTVFHLHSADKEGRQNAGGGEGNLKTDATEPGTPQTKGVVDPTGKKRVEVTTVQTPAAHEFGHAIGLKHVHCDGSDDVCYGVTAEERQDVMGAGGLLQVVKRNGKVVHDDFAPFEAIAKTWGNEHLTGAMARFNTWSAV